MYRVGASYFQKVSSVDLGLLIGAYILRDCLMRLIWAKTLMTRQCFACLLAAFWFYIYISSVHVIIYKNVVPACLQNTSRLTMCQRCIFAKFASGQLLAGCKFHSVSRLPDANFIQAAPAGCKLLPASSHVIQNNQFACGQRPQVGIVNSNLPS